MWARVKRGPKNKVKGIQWGLSSNPSAHPVETVSESIKFCLDSVSHLEEGGGEREEEGEEEEEKKEGEEEEKKEGEEKEDEDHPWFLFHDPKLGDPLKCENGEMWKHR